MTTQGDSIAKNFSPAETPQEVSSSSTSTDEAHFKRTWYRTTFFQATVVGLAAFAAPGLYNAMQSTGAGGQQTPYLVMYVFPSLSPESVLIGKIGQEVQS